MNTPRSTTPAPQARAASLGQSVLAPLAWGVGATVGGAALAAAVIIPRTAGLLQGALLATVVALLVTAWLTFAARLLRRRVEEPLAVAAEATAAMARVDKLATTGRLAAGIAHEVGNPLSAIANYAHLVRQRTGGSARVDEPLDGLEREIERIDRIVRGLLDYARPRRLTPKAIRVDEVINDVLRLMTDQGVLRRITVQRDVEAGDAAVYAERHDLEQVFVNLLLNAADAMHGVGQIGLRSRTVSAATFQRAVPRRTTDDADDRFPHAVSGRALRWLERTDRADAVLQIVVADSGTGISPGDADRVFEPFFSTKTETRGTGLGLAIVAQTIDSLGGTIWAQQAREGGAAFVLLLPLHGTSPGSPAVARGEE